MDDSNKIVQYQVSAVTRYSVTEYIRDGKSQSHRQIGEFANVSNANVVAEALARTYGKDPFRDTIYPIGISS